MPDEQEAAAHGRQIHNRNPPTQIIEIGFNHQAQHLLEDIADALKKRSHDKHIERLLEQIMATAQELKVSVDNLTKEVAENNALLDQLEQTNNTNATTIATLTEQVNALNISIAEKDALLAGLDEIKTAIDTNAEALNARQAPTPTP